MVPTLSEFSSKSCGRTIIIVQASVRHFRFSVRQQCIQALVLSRSQSVQSWTCSLSRIPFQIRSSGLSFYPILPSYSSLWVSQSEVPPRRSGNSWLAPSSLPRHVRSHHRPVVVFWLVFVVCVGLAHHRFQFGAVAFNCFHFEMCFINYSDSSHSMLATI